MAIVCSANRENRRPSREAGQKFTLRDMTRDKDPVREGDSSSSPSPVDASSSGSWSMEEGVRRVGRTTGIAGTPGVRTRTRRSGIRAHS